MNSNHQTAIAVATDKANAIALGYECYQRLIKIWSEAGLGLVLSNAYFTTNPLTTEELAERCNVSSETIRRWLKPLIAIDRVRVIKKGRTVRYKAREQWANHTAEMLMQMHDEAHERRGQTKALNVVRLATSQGVKIVKTTK